MHTEHTLIMNTMKQYFKYTDIIHAVTNYDLNERSWEISALRSKDMKDQDLKIVVAWFKELPRECTWLIKAGCDSSTGYYDMPGLMPRPPPPPSPIM